jgi:hypothetical protein
MYRKFLLRDAAIALGSALLWALVAGRAAVPGPVGDFSGVLVGVLLGGCALLTHEWGHFLGAVASRSTIAPGRSLRSPFGFSFDTRQNSQAQFVAMSVGGWIGTAAWVWAVYAWFPQDDLTSRVAHGTALISATLAAVIEIPLVARALWTGKLPRVETQRA